MPPLVVGLDDENMYLQCFLVNFCSDCDVKKACTYKVILGSSESISPTLKEAIKEKEGKGVQLQAKEGKSMCTQEWFATFHLLLQ